jgi:hypothetical protein
MAASVGSDEGRVERRRGHARSPPIHPPEVRRNRQSCGSVIRAGTDDRRTEMTDKRDAMGPIELKAQSVRTEQEFQAQKQRILG